jgi:hypothetical protein
MKIEVWNLDRIRPYPNNPRINDDADGRRMIDALVQKYPGLLEVAREHRKGQTSQ